ncbi:MAG TPA: hypothetical protein VF530_17825, partial [Planctomycetota bacterium]
NAYLSFLHYPILRARGVSRGDYRHVSGIPLVGSLVVLVALFLGLDGNLRIAAWTLIALDTGGLHWFVLSLAVQGLRRRRD